MLPLYTSEEPSELNKHPIFYWNHVALEMNRVTHSLNGPQTGPTMSSRALGLLHLAIHDAYFAIDKGYKPYLPGLEPVLDAGETAEDAEQAMAGAAITVLDDLYSRGGAGISVLANHTLLAHLKNQIDNYPKHIDTLSVSYRFGARVARKILEILGVRPGEPGADSGRYEPKSGRFFFRDEPLNPVRLLPVDPNNPSGPEKPVRMYHGPFYGTTTRPFATHQQHKLADPPKDDDEYQEAVREVVALGGAPGRPKTVRSADQTVAALFWAYDGANLIGTPPRLYNQIVRQIAWSQVKADAAPGKTTAEFVRLLALVNVAMADAGRIAWREKYHFEYWRPLTGVREHDAASGPGAQQQNGRKKELDKDADPFWEALGAPETNTNKISFKPPFPAYPSGHATFGAAAFQITRLFYKKERDLQFDANGPDEIAFAFVSDELNGISRDLHQPYSQDTPIQDQPGDVRTRVVRHFESLWDAILENGASRVFLGVHWRFDAFASEDVIETTNPDGSTVYRDSKAVNYKTTGTRSGEEGQFPIGGVPLGIAIANDIFEKDMTPPAELGLPTDPAQMVVDPASTSRDALTKSSNTNIR
ncbi:vanadium-dependent haloperoxidase [Azospirillum sp. SYSU D00513]|uniref:vanadium-dependent haloperoxidase n=1 Tax=Azospirillum sp. SYSU D00513 TaxID=2812561 RepID=UPI001A96BE7B|nr:vanadium-dependent haloperoxidase [Azospirillum sp. SYSU D00513]